MGWGWGPLAEGSLAWQCLEVGALLKRQTEGCNCQRLPRAAPQAHTVPSEPFSPEEQGRRIITGWKPGADSHLGGAAAGGLLIQGLRLGPTPCRECRALSERACERLCGKTCSREVVRPVLQHPAREAGGWEPWGGGQCAAGLPCWLHP